MAEEVQDARATSRRPHPFIPIRMGVASCEKTRNSGRCATSDRRVIRPGDRRTRWPNARKSSRPARITPSTPPATLGASSSTDPASYLHRLPGRGISIKAGARCYDVPSPMRFYRETNATFASFNELFPQRSHDPERLSLRFARIFLKSISEICAIISATEAAIHMNIHANDVIIDRISYIYLPYNWKMNVAMMGWGLVVDIAGNQKLEKLADSALNVRLDHPFIA